MRPKMNEEMDKLLSEIHDKIQDLASQYQFKIENDKIVISKQEDLCVVHYSKDLNIAPF